MNEKEFQHGELEEKSCTKIELIRVQKYEESIMELKTPVNEVKSPRKDWIFEIDNDSIKSVDPTKNCEWFLSITALSLKILKIETNFVHSKKIHYNY